MPVQRPYNPNAKRMAEMMQADLAKVGINAKLVSYEWGEYRKRLQAGEHQMGQLGWTGDNGDPDNFFFLLGCDAARVGGQNISKWCNKDFDDLLNKARQTCPTRRSAPSSTSRCRRSRTRRRRCFLIAHSVVYEPIRKEVDGLQGQPARPARVLRRRPANSSPADGIAGGRIVLRSARCSRVSADDRTSSSGARC